MGTASGPRKQSAQPGFEPTAVPAAVTASDPRNVALPGRCSPSTPEPFRIAVSLRAPPRQAHRHGPYSLTPLPAQRWRAGLDRFQLHCTVR